MAGQLLPSSAAPFAVALEAATSGIEELPVAIATLWDPATCPAEHLPWLAWAFSVDVWDADWSEAVKRQVIAASIGAHRRKGTKSALVEALADAGYGEAAVQEAADAGLVGADAGWGVGPAFEVGYWPEHWTDYRVIVAQPITARGAATIRSLLSELQPLRSALRSINASIFFTIGDGLWSVGNEIVVGGTYPLDNG